jgi:hypothetical protein
MANTILTPTAVTREALRILHQKLNFIGTINRQYDSSYAQDGAKIGDSLKIRLPNQYTVRSGAALNVQDTTESSVTLQVGTQKGVDVNFTSAELTLDLDDFSDRVLEPAMSVLASNIENDAISMYKDVNSEVSDVGASASLALVLQTSKRLTDNLSPVSMRSLNLETTANADLVSAVSGLFNDPKKIAQQYREGMVANDFLGYSSVYQNTHWPLHTTGSDDGTGDHKVNGADQTGSSITHNSAGSGTFKQGDIITFVGCNRVHPETKADTGKLMQFTVTSDMSASAVTVAISPAIVTSGATQNVSASPTNSGAIFKRESDESTAIGADADYYVSMGYHKDAFAFATADLVLPKGVDFSAREVMDGVSMRIVRDYDINNDKLPCRIDVLYGYKSILPELACRLGLN